MKRFAPLFIFAFFATLYSNAQDQAVKPASNTATKQEKLAEVPNLPYKPFYANDFEIASPKYSKWVMQLWKDFDNNTLDNSAWLFDENIEISLADGMQIKGKKAALESVKNYRSYFTSAKSQVHAILPVTNDNNKEVAVSIWGSEELTDKEGKIKMTLIHEVWFFNEEGKVVRMIQFEQKAPKM